MATVGDDLDWCQGILQDTTTPGADGRLWNRQSLRDAYNDAYRELLTRSQAVRRLTILDVPGRFTWTGTHAWEARFADGGTFWPFGWEASGDYACTSLWEVQVLEGLTPDPGSEGVTQEWERAYCNPTHQYYRFALPRDNERIAAMWYDHRRLMTLETRALDGLWRHWMSLGDFPLAWTMGTGQSRQFDLYEIVTTYQQGYSLDALHGTPRWMAGDRTWEAQDDTQLWGIARTVVSTERQYAAREGQWGLPREWHTSDDALMVLEVIGPDVPDLAEDQRPTLIPPQCQKYLRFGVLANAWAQQGEGHNPPLAAVCRLLFERGMTLLRLLADLAHADRHWQRGMTSTPGVRRPPRVQLPATYPRA